MQILHFGALLAIAAALSTGSASARTSLAVQNPTQHETGVTTPKAATSHNRHVRSRSHRAKAHARAHRSAHAVTKSVRHHQKLATAQPGKGHRAVRHHRAIHSLVAKHHHGKTHRHAATQ